MYKGPILWGHDACYQDCDACNEDQSYETVHIATCTYVSTASSEGSMSRSKDQLYGNSTHTKSSCQKEYFSTGCVQQYTESRYIDSVTCTNMHNSS